MSPSNFLKTLGITNLITKDVLNEIIELNDLTIVKLESRNIFFNISAPFFFKTLVQSNVLEIVFSDVSFDAWVDSYNSSWKKLDFSPWKLNGDSWKRKNKDTTNI